MTRTTKQDAMDRMDQGTDKLAASAEDAFGRQANKGILADKVAEELNVPRRTAAPRQKRPAGLPTDDILFKG